ncbi:MAG: hypothetical protein ACXABY_11295 [Candidatus Thorarchaeota archaeon]|jgi:hypothetical protein
MKKSIIAMFLAALLMVSTITMLAIPVAAAISDDYVTVKGVLSSDNYVLYPFETTSLDFGFSKYGEMIDGTGDWPDVGLQYPGYEEVMTFDQRLGTSRDAFANEQVAKNLWLNGWLMEARYTHRSYGDRRVLTMAMSADMNTYGGDWLVGHSDDLWASPFGGRKTTGYATTEDIEVLYDGPRKYIAQTTNHIYDWSDGDDDGVVDHPDETWEIIELTITFIFNKVKKEVIILKDVKIIISGKALESPIDVQFSNREEWDLGPEPNWESYAHFYHQENSTSYGTNDNTPINSTVHLADGIMREYINATILGDDQSAGDTYQVDVTMDEFGAPIVSGSYRVYVNDVLQEEGSSLDYIIDLDTGVITWQRSLEEDDEITVIYKLWKWIDAEGESTEGFDVDNPPGIPHLYDVAQIISSDSEYVGFKAFWPTLSDYTVDGWTLSLEPLINIAVPDIVPSEPEIPFTIGEWDFMLGKDYPLQFRGVEVVGIVNYHDADDAQASDLNEDGTVGNKIDREVLFQLDEVFIPWDLESAVHKDTTRHVEFFDYDEDDLANQGSPIDLDDVPHVHLDKVPLARAAWWSYAAFSERILADGVLITPYDAIMWEDSTTPLMSTWLSYPYTYTFGQVPYFYEWDSDDDEWIPWETWDSLKVLYSANTEYETYYTDFGPGRYEWVVVGRDAASVDSIGSAMITAAIKQKNITIGLGGIDLAATTVANSIPYVMAMVDEGDTAADYKDEMGRAYLLDDWCTYWPVASSNMLSVGGPIANLLTYYANDFTDAIYGLAEYTPSSTYDGMITGVTDWNRGWDGTWNTYESTEDTGYAVISTYLDINGTVLLNVWGHWGRDTYYAAEWLHGNVERGISPGIIQLQDAPDHLTSIIIEIDYEEPMHPEYSIVECLGTITEFFWEHGTEDKGGIHDP